MTDGVRLPAGAHNVWIYESPFSPDMYTCLMFQADSKGIRKFVEAVSGRPLNEFTKENDRHGIQRYFPKTEPWAAAQIEHGRYYRRGKSRGGIAVDMDRRIVYLVPMSALSPVKPK